MRAAIQGGRPMQKQLTLLVMVLALLSPGLLWAES